MDKDTDMSVWVHNDCGGRVFWDMSGGFCERCEDEGLDQEDTEQMSADDIEWRWVQRTVNQETRAYLGMMEYARQLLTVVLIGSVEPLAADGCNDAAGSEVAQVRKGLRLDDLLPPRGLDLPDQSQSNSLSSANDPD